MGNHKSKVKKDIKNKNYKRGKKDKEEKTEKKTKKYKIITNSDFINSDFNNSDFISEESNTYQYHNKSDNVYPSLYPNFVSGQWFKIKSNLINVGLGWDLIKMKHSI